MAEPVGALRVEISANAAAFERAMAKARGIAQETGRGLQAFGDRVSGIGVGLTKFVTGPLVAFGAGVAKAGIDFQQAMATIRTDTGATGAALDALGQDLRAAMATGPESVETVAQALAGLNTRLGLTGEPLQQLTRQMLNLSDVTRSDVSQVVTSATRVFGDWSIATEDQGRALDFLYRTTQQTGVGLTRLSELVVFFGAPLRQLGFTFEQSAALMGKFEKEGVNVETVMSGLRIGLANLASAGATDIPAAFRAAVESIKSAGTQAQATGIAMELFGKRAGADVAAAIREGRLSIDELVAALQAAPDTIAAADAASETFTEQMAQLKNQVLAAAAPLGTSLLRAFEELRPTIERVIAFIARAVDAFVALPAPVQKAALVVAAAFAIGGPVLLAVGTFAQVIGGLIAATGPIGLFIAVAALIVSAWMIWGDDITALITRVVTAITNLFMRMKERVLAIWDATAGRITDTATKLYKMLVGGSIVPDMIDDIIAEFGRGQAGVVAATDATAEAVAASYRQMAEASTKSAANLGADLAMAVPQVEGTWARMSDAAGRAWSSIASAFTSTIVGMIQGTASFGQFFVSVLGTMLSAVVGFVVELIANWVKGMVAKTTADTTAATVHTASETAMTTVSAAQAAARVGISAAANKAMLAGAAASLAGVAATGAAAMGVLGAVTAATAAVLVAIGAALTATVVGAGLAAGYYSAAAIVGAVGTAAIAAGTAAIAAAMAAASGTIAAALAVPLAAGGIVTGPTLALIGEGFESEAVMPLSKMPKLMGDRGDINLTVMLDGRAIGRAAFKAIPGEYRLRAGFEG